MDIVQCSFEELGFSNLFIKYVHQFETLATYFEGNPFNDVIKERHVKHNQAGCLLSDYIPALQKYQRDLGLSELQAKNLDKLSVPNARVVVTGQQLGVYGGPVFTLYKILTAIHHARVLEKQTGHTVVPVFWMADEDHDFEEIATLKVPNDDIIQFVKLNEQTVPQQVSSVIIENISNFREQASQFLFETDFSAELWSVLDSYTEGNTHAMAFARLMDRLFSGFGVVIAGSNHPEIKKLAREMIKTSIKKSGEIYSGLEKTSKNLEEHFHRQVHLSESNLFYISDKKERLKIDKDDSGNWVLPGTGVVSEEEVLNLADEKPECFSPNVFLRPVFQDLVLPTVGYVAGPGELAYFAQMKSIYEYFNLRMPLIFPRHSFTLVEPPIERIYSKLPFGFPEYSKRIEELEKAYVGRTETADLEGIFGQWKQNLAQSFDQPKKTISNIDQSLNSTVDKVLSQFTAELDKLKGRVYKSVKQQDQTQLQRIRKVKAQFFPENSLQEREISFIYFLNKYGLDLPGKILSVIEEHELGTDTHHLLYL